MARAGRKPKAGTRHPGGRLKQPPVMDREMDVMRTVLEARCRHSNLPPSRENLERARSALAGTSLGRERLEGAITEVQFEAGTRWAALRATWVAIKGLPRPTPGGIDMAVPGRGEAGPALDMPEALDRAYHEALVALRAAGPRARSSVEGVCLLDCIALDRVGLRAGLDALAEVFGLPADDGGEQ